MADLTTAALPPKNHNKPPSDVEILGEQLTLRHVHLMRAAEGHAAICEKMPGQFTQENEATYTADLIRLMQNCAKETERRRKEEKDPFLRQGQYVDHFFGEVTGKLEAAIKIAKRPLDDWLQRKAHVEQQAREREFAALARERDAAIDSAAIAPVAERAQAIDQAISISNATKVAEAIAAAPIATMASTKGTVATAALATKWVGIIKDIDQLDLMKLRPYIAAAELQKALDRYVKQGGRQIEGAEIKEIIEAKVK